MSLIARITEWVRPLEEREAERRQEYQKFLYRQVFDTPEGRQVLADLAARHFVLSTTIRVGADGKADPILTAYNEGRRDLVTDLLRFIEEPLIDDARSET